MRTKGDTVQLATYLNDHLSGSTAVLDLLGHMEQAHPDLAPLLKDLRHEIELERKELEALIDRLGATHGPVRRAAAWVAEKFARLKLTVDDPPGNKLKRLESLESVAVGIHGKWSLWQALKVIPAADGPNYDRLIAQAEAQRERVEVARLDAARTAFEGEGKS